LTSTLPQKLYVSIHHVPNAVGNNPHNVNFDFVVVKEFVARMNVSSSVDVVTSGSNIAELPYEDSAGAMPLLPNQASLGSSEPILVQSQESNSTNDLYLQGITNVGTVNESHIQKSNSDSDESNESGSLPSKSSSTIDTSGSQGKDDRHAVRSGTGGTRLKSSKRKKDRSKLRKGKWTVSIMHVGSQILSKELSLNMFIES
jgi:hypothetical protein